MLYVHSWDSFHSTPWEVPVRMCIHGDDPPSVPLECLQCAQQRQDQPKYLGSVLRPAEDLRL